MNGRGFCQAEYGWDAQGNLVSEATYLYTCGSKYVEPGETTFISFQADMSEMEKIAGEIASFEEEQPLQLYVDDVTTE